MNISFGVRDVCILDSAILEILVLPFQVFLFFTYQVSELENDNKK